MKSNPLIVVKFQDSQHLPYNTDISSFLLSCSLGGPWKTLVHAFPGIQIAPLYKKMSDTKIKDLVDTGMSLDPDYHPPNMLTFFEVRVPTSAAVNPVLDALKQWHIVERAYVAPKVTFPQIQPDLSGNQTYLNSRTDGIGASLVWNTAGALGDGQRLVDIEGGWKEDHADLAGPATVYVYGENRDSVKDHGTSVLGIIYSQHNSKLVSGIAPNLSEIHLVSKWDENGEESIFGALSVVWSLAALGNIRRGDVILLEVQADIDDANGITRRVPVEADWASYWIIRNLTANQRVVVEAAANGTYDLDQFKHPIDGKILNRASRHFRDSRAVMVACSGPPSAAAYTRYVANNGSWGSNYGARVDCFAHGESVYSLTATGTPPVDDWTPDFGGTSAAAAIVAGAALVVQGVHEKASGGRRLGPVALRKRLADKNVNTPPDPVDANRIGMMPDLEAIITNLLAELAPS